MSRALRFRLAALALPALTLPALAAAQEMTVMDPGRSGIPGEEVRHVAHAPDGDVWVGARWPFWGSGGVGILDRLTREWTVLAKEDGTVPSAFINDIEFDAEGAAWVATGSGLVRVLPDLTVTLWDSSNSPMTLDVVSNLSIAPDGTIWLNSSSTNSGGDAIYAFDGADTWERYAVPDQLPFAAPWTDLEDVFADSQGRVWVSNDTLTGVARFDGNSWTLIGDGVDKFDLMAEDNAGNLWLGTNLIGSGSSFYRYDGNELKSYGLASMTALAVDPEDGAIYVGNWHGTVLRSTDGGESFQTFLSGLNIIDSIAPDPKGEEVWVATLGAVGRFSGNGTLLEDFNTWNTGMPDHFVDRFDVDRSGNLWIATGEAGLSRFDGRVWRNWGNHNVGSEPYPWAGNEPMGGAFEDSQGRVWMGGNGVGLWNPQTSEFDGFWNWQNNPGFGVGQYPFFAEDMHGTVFASTEHGTTFHFDESAQLWVQEPLQPYAVLGLPGMESDSAGNVWVAAWFDIHVWDGTSWSKIDLPYNDYLFDKGGVYSFAIGPDDTLYLGTVDGLVTYDGASFEFYEPSQSPLPAPFAIGVDVREDGLVGLCARGTGPTQLSTICLVDGDLNDPAAWTVYSYGDSPMPHWQTEDCAFGPQGNLWASTVSEGAAVVHCGAWQDLGSDLAGELGEPYLKGYGVPTPGATVGFELTRVPSFAVGVHVIGGAAVPLPLLGGTLIPDPAELLVFVADNQGRAGLEVAWPADQGPGAQVYLQSWTLDDAAAQGVSVSNAAVLTAP